MKVFLFILISLLTACSTVGWGKKYEVIRADERAVHIKYDRTLIDREKIEFIAIDQCGRFNKKAVASGMRAEDDGGFVLLQRFRCERM